MLFIADGTWRNVCGRIFAIFPSHVFARFVLSRAVFSLRRGIFPEQKAVGGNQEIHVEGVAQCRFPKSFDMTGDRHSKNVWEPTATNSLGLTL